MASLQKYMIHPHKVPFFAKKCPKIEKKFFNDIGHFLKTNEEL